MDCIVGSNIYFQYNKDQPILENINFSIPSGKITAILGKNGCGKSTLIKLIMGFLPLSKGKIIVNGFDITTKNGLFHLRKHCGIVFQNPDNQFVSPVLEDDIRFGLNNHKIPESEHSYRINYALKSVFLQGFEKKNTATLSGGQKQRAAAAGILALEDDILIFDEATSMLDPDGKAKMIECIRNFRSENRTIIMITQNTEDSVDADHLILMAEHQILAEGTPKEILPDIDLLNQASIQVPFPIRVFHDLKKRGIYLEDCPLKIQDLAEDICRLN